MTELNKRHSAKHKAALSRVNQHLKAAKSAHVRGMHSLAEVAKILVESNKLGKAADGDGLASALAGAHGYFGKAASSIDDAQAHLNQALSHFGPDKFPLLVPSGYSRSGNDRPTHSVAGATAIVPSLDDMTEGPVQQLSDAYSEKNAAAITFAKMVRTGQGRHVIGKPQPWASFLGR